MISAQGTQRQKVSAGVLHASDFEQTQWGSAAPAQPQQRRYVIAWLLCLVFYALEYASRSAPSVMMPELGKAFGTSTVGVAALLGTYYYTYSLTSLVAGAALDRAGAKWVIPIGLILFGAGCVLFRMPNEFSAYAARLLQGAGSAFAFTGAVYLATHGISVKWLGTAIGSTQCLGMAGGFAGQFVVGPVLQHGFRWQTVWMTLGIAALIVAALLFVVSPEGKHADAAKEGVLQSFLEPNKIVFRNPQSYLCRIVSGLLFVPTTVGTMIWGVTFFQKDLGLSHSSAVTTASLVTLGWVAGAPILGWVADRIGRRKPVLIAGIVIMICFLSQLAFFHSLLPLAVTCFLIGFGSGAAMIPYSVMEEVNPGKVKGTAAGAMNFLAFGVSAIVGPIFGKFVGPGFLHPADLIKHFQSAILFWIAGTVLALLLTFFLRETGGSNAKA